MESFNIRYSLSEFDLEKHKHLFAVHAARAGAKWKSKSKSNMNVNDTTKHIHYTPNSYAVEFVCIQFVLTVVLNWTGLA